MLVALLWFIGSTGASLAVFKLAVVVYKRIKNPLLNPLLVSASLIIIILGSSGLSLDSYEAGVAPISFFLGPATVALAYSIYVQRNLLKSHFIPICAGCLVGSIVSMISAYVLCKALGLTDDLALSFIPKSVTTPIALSIAEQIGGVSSITVAAVIITGILGAMLSPLLVRLFRVKNQIAQGVAIGACSHAVGTSRALEMGELEGAMAGISLSVSGLMTVGIVLIAKVFI